MGLVSLPYTAHPHSWFGLWCQWNPHLASSSLALVLAQPLLYLWISLYLYPGRSYPLLMAGQVKAIPLPRQLLAVPSWFLEADHWLVTEKLTLWSLSVPALNVPLFQLRK